jgi:hypothetical protein
MDGKCKALASCVPFVRRPCARHAWQASPAKMARRGRSEVSSEEDILFLSDPVAGPGREMQRFSLHAGFSGRTDVRTAHTSMRSTSLGSGRSPAPFSWFLSVEVPRLGATSNECGWHKSIFRRTRLQTPTTRQGPAELIQKKNSIDGVPRDPAERAACRRWLAIFSNTSLHARTMEAGTCK